MLYDENEELSTFKRVEPTYSEKYVASDNNKLSVTQFQNDPEVQKQGQVYLEWVAQNQALTPEVLVATKILQKLYEMKITVLAILLVELLFLKICLKMLKRHTHF